MYSAKPLLFSEARTNGGYRGGKLGMTYSVDFEFHPATLSIRTAVQLVVDASVHYAESCFSSPTTRILPLV